MWKSDTTSGLASNPTVGNLMEKLNHWRSFMFWRNFRLTGAETVCASSATPEAKEKFMKTWVLITFILKETADDLSKVNQLQEILLETLSKKKL